MRVLLYIVTLYCFSNLALGQSSEKNRAVIYTAPQEQIHCHLSHFTKEALHFFENGALRSISISEVRRIAMFGPHDKKLLLEITNREILLDVYDGKVRGKGARKLFFTMGGVSMAGALLFMAAKDDQPSGTSTTGQQKRAIDNEDAAKTLAGFGLVCLLIGLVIQ